MAAARTGACFLVYAHRETHFERNSKGLTKILHSFRHNLVALACRPSAPSSVACVATLGAPRDDSQGAGEANS